MIIGLCDLIEMLKKHEGFRTHPYRCTADKLTIGYGRNLDDIGITTQEAEFLLMNDIETAIQDTESIFQGFAYFSKNRQNALVNMMFNLGKTRFVKFRKMVRAINKGDWIEAAEQAKDSRWHRQVGSRALEIEHLLETG